MLLDDRFRAARAALSTLPVADAPPIEQVVRHARRRRAVRSAALAVVGLAGVGAVWAAASPTGGGRPAVPTETVATTTTAVDGAPIVMPLAFGAADLRYLPGVWGTDADTMVVAGVVRISAGGVSATLIDDGPAPPVAENATDDPLASFATAPRLGPYGPAVDVEQRGATTTVSATIGGRRVVVSSDGAGADRLVDLLRSVTTDPAVQPIRPSSGQVPMPDVAGLDYRDATARLALSGLRAAWTLTSRDDVAIGAVVSTSPAAGQSAPMGSMVVLTVNGPRFPLRVDGPFLLVSGPADVASPGFMDRTADRPGPPTSGEAPAPVLAPIVFLHGELVGLFALGDGPFGAGELITRLADPMYRYEPPAPAPTVPAQSLTQTARLGDVEVSVPAGWSIVTDACPATRTVTVGRTPPGCEPAAPGPWISLQPAPAELTPCRTGGIETAASAGNLRACWTDNLSDGATDAFVLLGSAVLVMNQYGSVTMQDQADLQAAIDSLAAPSARGEVDTTPHRHVVEAVAAIIDGRCDDLDALLSPIDASAPICDAHDAAAPVDVDRLGVMSAPPVNHLDDLTYDGYEVTTEDGDTWHVEYRTYYDPGTRDATTYITRIEPPA